MKVLTFFSTLAGFILTIIGFFKAIPTKGIESVQNTPLWVAVFITGIVVLVCSLDHLFDETLSKKQKRMYQGTALD
jgi:hypothetical protein